MGRIADGDCFGPVRCEHAEQSAAPNAQVAQNSRVSKNQGSEHPAGEAPISISNDDRVLGALKCSEQLMDIDLIFRCHWCSPASGVIT
jgi:hypothetical protein